MKKALVNELTGSPFEHFNLQFFAADSKDNKGSASEEDDDTDDDDGSDDDDDDNKGEQDSKDDKKSKGNKSAGGKSGGSEKTFTQAQVNRMMTKEKNQGRNAAYNELGIDPKDSKMVSMMKAFVESQKTDEQKAAEKDAQDKAAINQANLRAATAEAKAEAMMLGVKSQFVDDVVALAMSKMTDDSDIKTLIGEYKTKYPMWFGAESDDDDNKNNKAGQKGTGSSLNNNKGKSGKNDKGLGTRLAAQRKSGSKKSSYWGK